MLDFSFILLVALSSIPIIFKKHLLNDLNNTEFFILYMAVSVVGTFINYIYQTQFRNEKVNLLKKITENKKIFWFILVIVLLKFFTSYARASYLRNNALSKYGPIHKSLLIICMLIFGVIFFKEKLTTTNILGVMLIIGGIYLLK